MNVSLQQVDLKMGLVRSTLLLAVMVALAAFAVEKQFPKTLDKIVDSPVLHKFLFETRKHMKTAGKYGQDFKKVASVKFGHALKACSPYLETAGKHALDFKEFSVTKFHLLKKTCAEYIQILAAKYNGEKTEPEKSSATGASKAKSKAGKKKLPKNILKAGKGRVFTAAELKQYGGGEGSKGLYLALLGQVFDVSKGERYYGPGGGYAFFAGRDASRSFVTGEFDEQNLVDDVSGLTPQDYLGLKTWLDMYHKDYTYVGKVAGRYYTASGAATPYTAEVGGWVAGAEEAQRARQGAEQAFPPCNSEWSQAEGTTVWCTTMSGGVERAWAGVPRQLHEGGSSAPRCACVSSDRLSDPRLRPYAACPPSAPRCHVGH